jgi:hypothetical protein
VGALWALVKKTVSLNELDHVALFRRKMREKSFIIRRQPPLEPHCRISPKTPRKPSGADVDTALAFEELIQRLGIRLMLDWAFPTQHGRDRDLAPLRTRSA